MSREKKKQGYENNINNNCYLAVTALIKFDKDKKLTKGSN